AQKRRPDGSRDAEGGRHAELRDESHGAPPRAARRVPAHERRTGAVDLRAVGRRRRDVSEIRIERAAARDVSLILSLIKALLAYVARVAVARRCGRMEWSVLNWNEPAIRFYRRMGARAMDEWTVYRLTGETLTRLASEPGV